MYYNDAGVELVAGDNGNGTKLNQLDCPRGLALDENQDLYISDFKNHRVMKWARGASQGEIVAGYLPEGTEGARRRRRLADTYSGGATQRIPHDPDVHGCCAKGSAEHHLAGPWGLAYVEGNLLIADHLNNRIMRWEPGATVGEEIVQVDQPMDLAASVIPNTHPPLVQVVVVDAQRRLQGFNMTFYDLEESTTAFPSTFPYGAVS